MIFLKFRCESLGKINVIERFFAIQTKEKKFTQNIPSHRNRSFNLLLLLFLCLPCFFSLFFNACIEEEDDDDDDDDKTSNK